MVNWRGHEDDNLVVFTQEKPGMPSPRTDHNLLSSPTPRFGLGTGDSNWSSSSNQQSNQTRYLPSKKNVPTSPRTSPNPYAFSPLVSGFLQLPSTSALRLFQLGMELYFHWESHKWLLNARYSMGEAGGLSSCFVLWCLWHIPNHRTVQSSW